MPKKTRPADPAEKLWPPSLTALKNRLVGAETLNFKKIIVKLHDAKGNYYQEKALIWIDHNNKIQHRGDPEYRFTDEEEEQINAELEGVKFPTSVPVSWSMAEAQRRVLKADDDKWFCCPTVDRSNVIMCQLRVENDEGKNKYYVPWTYFSDERWRMMEPDGGLPFWKPKENRQREKIMVHEGAKAARYVDWMLNSDSKAAIEARKKHPWTSELEDYEHWGILGGALAPHRADYTELTREKRLELVYACDNDNEGKAAAGQFARYYRNKMRIIMYDDSFDLGWDMADPIPPEFYDKEGEYRGPKLRSIMLPATWATDKVKKKGQSGAPPHVLRPAFLVEWVLTVSPCAYVNKHWPHVVYYGNEEFNKVVRPFSDVDDTARLLHQHVECYAATLAYAPDKPSGVDMGGPDTRSFNTYKTPELTAKKGDASLWEEFIKHLIPDDGDREEVIRYVATLSERPATKMMYGMLLVSQRQGVGKSTLIDIMTMLVGEHNKKTANEYDIVQSGFNDYAGGCRLISIGEIYAGESTKAYNNLKELITEKTVKINRKFSQPYVMANWAHIVASSNSLKALKLPDDDRRWLVPEVTEDEKPLAFWTELRDWLRRDGPAIIKQWLINWLKKHEPVKEGAKAPMTSAKRQMVEESKGEGIRCIEDIFDELTETHPLNTTIVVSDQAIKEKVRIEVYNGKTNGRAEGTPQIKKVARGAGWYAKNSTAEHRSREFDGENKRVTMLSNRQWTLKHKFSELLNLYKKGERQDLVVYTKLPTKM